MDSGSKSGTKTERAAEAVAWRRGNSKPQNTDIRQDKGLSLSKLADLSLNTVVKIELDESPNPTIETIQRIAKALDVSVDDLLKK